MVTANSTQYQEEEEEEEEEQLVPLSAYVNVILDETESEEEREQVQCHQLPAAATFDVKVSNPPVLDKYCKREEQFKWCQTLRLCKRKQMSPLRQQQQSALAIDYGGLIAAVKHVNSKPPARQPDAKDFAEEEIDSDTAEVRAFNGQTTQLWFAVDQKKHAVNSTPELPQQSLQGVSTFALCETLPAHNMSGKDDNSTLDSDDDVFKKEDEDTYSENIDAAIQGMTRFGSYSTSDTHPSMSLAGQGTIGEREHGTSSHSGQESEKFGHDSKVAVSESGGLELERGKNASNRAINVWKARAMKEAMLENLIRLKFCEDITRAALEAGVLEIYNYDLNCELAYVDIFMSLMKMVCDAHLDVISEVNNAYHSYMLHDENVSDHVQSSITHEDSPSSLEQHSFLPFKWPIIDMARFEFESARPGTCFNSVCVLTNLPQVSMDRMQELVEALSRNVFCMINDPIQVVMPSGSSTGRTRGCAFLEFCDPDTAQICAMAVDGLTWGRGSFARIRGKLFRQYYVTSPAAEDWYTTVMNDNNASSSCSLRAISGTGSLSHATPISSTVERHYSRTAQRFQLDSGAAQEQTLLCDNDEDDSDTGEWDIQHPLDYTQFDSLAISDLSSNSASELDEPSQHDIAIQLGSDDEVLNDENLMQQREKRESDCDGADDESIDSHSVVEFQGYDDERLMDDFLFKKLAREYLITPVSSAM
ncbi:unnamed protein product [Peronospora belbahrii]|uniref:RRM domain-containing protein n=1 Tax=Peronospora belbahrii TaxID=622444 RepID=A0ABN8D130_9STRA|nr:unnamed protein product [Peronospora belbahrii]